ncbi:sulfotransferase [Alteromonas sp. Cnat3-28]|uniref:sulfotransferase n=1 Tax=Alteromonas sp. Cnat3-28 TaxID=2917729 RepID=UPI001EF4F7B3|nr:sulfotransferase [Alteromonas sp. Cnat3-28]MCG7644903.1 sulfotransferase [Alteromonas sp. Cnat3-28]
MKLTELELITELNRVLEKVQIDINKESPTSCLPKTFIVGCPRSGTTALLQYLANTGTWTYPTNFLTRFVHSTYVGSLVQEVLFNSKHGLIEQDKAIDFKSDYGRSSGVLNANEFFHFFRRFFPTIEIRHLDEENLRQVDINSLTNEIETLCQLTQKPFLAKGLMFQYNLSYFHQYLPNSVFVYVKREDEFVMQSIYKARVQELGNLNQWWSAKPAEYAWLKNKTPEEQIAGQVHFTNQAIEMGLKDIPLANKLEIKYEDFVSNPRQVYVNLLSKYHALGNPITESDLPQGSSLVNANKRSLSKETLDKMLGYLELFKGLNV